MAGTRSHHPSKGHIPFIPPKSVVTACMDAMEAKGHLTNTQRDEPTFQWADGLMNQVDSQSNDISMLLEAVFEVVIAQHIPGRSYNGYYLRFPSDEHSLRNPRVGYDLDALFSVKNAGGADAKDVCVPFVFKTLYRNGELADNYFHTIRACHHVMGEDLRRNFVYGVSSTHNNITSVFLSRSHCVKGQSFDPYKVPERLVELIISLAFATPEELGYEPRVHLTGDSFIYEFPPELPLRPTTLYFKVTNPILPRAPRHEETPGRVMRIWKVVEVESVTSSTPKPGCSEKVLKDAWVRETMRTEGEIQKQLFSAIRTFAQSPTWRGNPALTHLDDDDKDALDLLFQNDSFQDLFLLVSQESRGPVHHGPLALPSDDDVQDDTDYSKHNEEMARTTIVDPTLFASSGYEGEGEDFGGGPSEHRTRTFSLFDNVCTSLENLATFGEVFDVIKQTVIALRLMMCAGWVHRDISAGNILAYRPDGNATWRLQLADLELAREYDFSRKVDAITVGTPFFMAHEVHDRGKTYPVMEGHVSSWSAVSHNYRHDLEGVWWILLWLCFLRVSGHGRSRLAAGDIFTKNLLPSATRTRVYKSGLQFKDIADAIHEHLRPYLAFLENVRQEFHRDAFENRKDQEVLTFMKVNKTFELELAKLEQSRDEWGSVRLSGRSRRAEVLDPSFQPRLLHPNGWLGDYVETAPPQQSNPKSVQSANKPHDLGDEERSLRHSHGKRKSGEECDGGAREDRPRKRARNPAREAAAPSEPSLVPRYHTRKRAREEDAQQAIPVQQQERRASKRLRSSAPPAVTQLVATSQYQPPVPKKASRTQTKAQAASRATRSKQVNTSAKKMKVKGRVASKKETTRSTTPSTKPKQLHHSKKRQASSVAYEGPITRSRAAAVKAPV